MRSKEQVLVLQFDGLHENVSHHWHTFLKINMWSLVKKTIVLMLTRNMHSCEFKNSLLRWIGVNIGKDVFIAASAMLDPQFTELITIEDNVIIGMSSHIFTHEVTHTHIRLGKVHIGKNALVGALSTLRSGVSIGANSVVAMDAFVTQDVPFQTLILGVPPQAIKKISGIL